MVTYAKLHEFQLPFLPLQALTAHISAAVSLPFPLKFVDITSTDRLHLFRTGRTDAAIKGALALLHGAKVPLGACSTAHPLMREKSVSVDLLFVYWVDCERTSPALPLVPRDRCMWRMWPRTHTSRRALVALPPSLWFAYTRFAMP